MKFKGTAVLFVVLILLGGWVYWTDIRGRQERQLAEEAESKVFAVDDAEIVELRLTYPDRSIAARRNGEEWEFVAPEGLEADAGEWDTVAANVGRIDRDDSVTLAPADLAPYGLAEPAIRVDVLLADGTTEQILFGNENPRGIFDYLKLGTSDEVFLAATSWAGLFLKATDDLRDRTLLRFDQDGVETIEIAGNTQMSFVRDGTDWQLTRPLETAADNSQVSTLLGAIDFARAVRFADPQLSRSETGLDRPAWRIALDSEDGVHELLVGTVVSERGEEYYARDVSRDPVFIIDGELAGMLAEPLLEWRDRSIAAFDRREVNRIEISTGGDTIAMEQSDGDWYTVSNELVDFSQVSAMLNVLEFEQVTDILDEPGSLATYGLDDPRLHVVLKDSAGNSVLDGTFGSDAGDEDHLYWKSESEAAVKVLSKDVFDRFSVAEADLLAPPPPRLPAP
jgi:hypothetical protein